MNEGLSSTVGKLELSSSRDGRGKRESQGKGSTLTQSRALKWDNTNQKRGEEDLLRIKKITEVDTVEGQETLFRTPNPQKKGHRTRRRKKNS